MKNKPQKVDILNDPVCGNQFTEAGEECDCGTVEVIMPCQLYTFSLVILLFLEKIIYVDLFVFAIKRILKIKC